MDNYITYAPIVIFVYNRPIHTKITLDKLALNKYASQSDLFIYSDAAKTSSVENDVKSVRFIISQYSSRFKSVKIIERDINYGLARNIIEGVGEIIHEYKKIIVLEDDLITSPLFLEFMNFALEKYKDSKNVWHISGWNYPINVEGLDDAFFWRTMNCWGWATWADRWQFYYKDPYNLMTSWSKNDIHRFNLDGANNFWAQVIANANGKLNTWAVFWYATIFLNSGLCLNPSQSYVENIGNDGSGQNCGVNDHYRACINHKETSIFPDVYAENSLAVHRIKSFYKGIRQSIFLRVLGKLKKVFFK